MTAFAEILQAKKEWQMCIVEWFWSLGKATWMKIGLKSGQEMMRLFFSLQIWILYEMLLHQTVLLFNLAELSSFPWFLSNCKYGACFGRKSSSSSTLISPLWLCIGSNQINRIHESSLMWICNTSTYLLQLVHLCWCNSKWWARWSN